MKRLLVLPLLFLTLFNGTPAFSGDFQTGVDAASKGDFATALREWEPLAKQGKVLAQYKLGYMYNNGQGVLQDYKSAFKWYSLAAKQGYAVPERRLLFTPLEAYDLVGRHLYGGQWNLIFVAGPTLPDSRIAKIEGSHGAEQEDYNFRHSRAFRTSKTLRTFF